MVNYPTKRAPQTQTQVQKKATSFGHRGMNLEEDLNRTNQYYLDLDLANIHKKPTPITIVKVDYPTRTKSKITEAYFVTPSTTDYNGVYRGRAIDFEAKEISRQTSFPMSKIHAHQLRHMESIVHHGGIAFMILRFTALDETYLVFVQDMLDYLKSNQRKSLPHAWVKAHCHLIPYSLTPPVHYLKVLDETVFKGV